MLVEFFPIEDVDSNVTQKSPGVYLFSRDGRIVAYVGRADNDIRTQIKQLVCDDYGYPYCFFEYTSSAKDAYVKECEYYHKYVPLDNTHHPTPPPGTNWKCPVVGCPLP